MGDVELRDTLGLEDLQLEPISENDFREVISDSKNLLRSKAVRKMGFVQEEN